MNEISLIIDLCGSIIITSSACERAFSTLKRIHTTRRNKQSQERIVALSFLAQEKAFVDEQFKNDKIYEEIFEEYYFGIK